MKMAKSTPSHFIFSPFSKTYMGPPSMRPSGDCTRYFTASRPSPYFVAMPNMPLSQHQSTAPGPPRLTAMATPTMLPVPMVAARAVASAPNWLTSPSESLSFLSERRMACSTLRCGKRRRMVRKMCVPKSSKIIGQPQSRPLSLWKNSCIYSCLKIW